MKFAFKAKKTFDRSIAVTFFEALQLKWEKSCKTLNRGVNQLDRPVSVNNKRNN